MKQRQLDAAYSLRNKLQERIEQYAFDVARAKKSAMEEQVERRVIEKMLYGPGFLPETDEVKKYLIRYLEACAMEIDGYKEYLDNIAKITADDRAKLKKVNERIHRLHTVGPDPQQEFDLEGEQ